jgi:acyl carrier protein
MAFEEIFDIEIPDDDLDKIATVDDINKLVASKLG